MTTSIQDYATIHTGWHLCLSTSNLDIQGVPKSKPVYYCNYFAYC